MSIASPHLSADPADAVPLRLYFIRHGETVWSLTGQHTGQSDPPLTPHGETMASALSTPLGGIAFSRVWTSPRLRARATCALAGLGADAETAPDLAEWDYGDYEGLRTAEIRALHPAWNLWESGCPGGETTEAVGRRADRLIARVHDLTGNIALFSHGQFGRALAARWIGLPVQQGQHFALDPASISILGFEAAHPRTRVIASWNMPSLGRLRATSCRPERTSPSPTPRSRPASNSRHSTSPT